MEYHKLETIQKIGILAGTFDPVHEGHITFALEAARRCDLDIVYLLPERLPRIKKNVTDFNHRLAMLELAVKNHKQLAVLKWPESQFTVSSTLPLLRAYFAPAEVLFLMGSDVLSGLGKWPGLGPLIIGLRGSDNKAELEKLLDKLKITEPVTFINSPKPHTTSTKTRKEGFENSMNSTVAAYIKENKLYSA